MITPEERAIFTEFASFLLSTRNRLLNSLSSGDNVHVVKAKQGQEVARAFDVELEDGIFQFLAERLSGFVFDGEENGVRTCRHGEDYYVIVDPLDGSDMAARGYMLCSIAVYIRRGLNGPVLFSSLTEISTGRQYNVLGEDAVTHGDKGIMNQTKALGGAFLVSYAAKRERIASIRQYSALYESALLFLNYGGPLDLAKIGCGHVDAFVEVYKGFHPRDFLAGANFLVRRGGYVMDLTGQPLSFDDTSGQRVKFVAACSKELCSQILSLITSNTP
jgi:fructose-1,6-bisphosphatase/inositol monophosphatase family enzyme